MARWMNRTKGSKSACLQMCGDGMDPAWVGAVPEDPRVRCLTSTVLFNVEIALEEVPSRGSTQQVDEFKRSGMLLLETVQS